MNIKASTIKEMLYGEGIDLVGIVDVDKLLLSYPPKRPAELMPNARSVIVMAVAHCMGSVYSPDIMLWTRNKIQTSRLLDRAAQKAARYLEREGYLSLPVSSDKPVEIFKINPETGRKLRQTRVAGHLSLKHAAVSCGIGVIGRSNLLLTPEFGPHQRLCAVITEAELEADAVRHLDLCDDCGECERACPSGALSGGAYNVDPCFMYWSYGFKRLPPSKLSEWPAFIRMLIAHYRRRDMLIESGQTFITDVDNCLECMRACPCGEHWKAIRPGVLPFQKSGGTVQ